MFMSMLTQSHETASLSLCPFFILHCGADERAEKERIIGTDGTEKERESIDRGDERTIKGHIYGELVHDFEVRCAASRLCASSPALL